MSLHYLQAASQHDDNMKEALKDTQGKAGMLMARRLPLIVCTVSAARLTLCSTTTMVSFAMPCACLKAV